MADITIDSAIDHSMRRPSATIWLVCLTVASFITWSAFAWVDEIVRAEGEVVSQSRPQIIQNLEGGILAELLVKEGDVVAPGDVLARLQGTQFQTVVDDLSEQVDALNIRRLRLEAEIDGAFDFAVPPDLAAGNESIVASEQALLKARQSDFRSRAEGAEAVYEQANTELSLLENMLEKKIVALIEVTRARKAKSDAEARYNEIITQMELDRASAYSGRFEGPRDPAPKPETGARSTGPHGAGQPDAGDCQ